MARTPLIAGNWKMNLDHLEAIATVQKLAFALPKEYYEKVDVAVTVPFTDLRSVQTLVEGDKLQITYGAQDVSEHEAGAYTGEISASMLAKLGCSWVVTGHSERRQYHHETDAQVAAKSKAALDKGISPIVCVGEPLEIREKDTHVEYVVEQTRASLEGLSAEELSRTVIAYEPVWAIGPGKTPPGREFIQEVAQVIKGITGGLDVVYGGGLKADNAQMLASIPEIAGGLIALTRFTGEIGFYPDEYIEIIRLYLGK